MCFVPTSAYYDITYTEVSYGIGVEGIDKGLLFQRIYPLDDHM